MTEERTVVKEPVEITNTGRNEERLRITAKIDNEEMIAKKVL